MIKSVGGYQIDFVKKRVRSLRLRVSKSGKIAMSVPYSISMAEAEKFALSQLSWLEKTVSKALKSSYNTTLCPDKTVRVLDEEKLLRLVPSRPYKVVETPDSIIVFGTEKNFVVKAESFIKNKLLEYTTAKMAYYERLTGLKCASINIKKMTAKWGLCRLQTKQISFALALAFKPTECIDYVVLHELVHVEFPRHDAAFYGFIERFMPDYKERIKLLKK